MHNLLGTYSLDLMKAKWVNEKPVLIKNDLYIQFQKKQEVLQSKYAHEFLGNSAFHYRIFLKISQPSNNPWTTLLLDMELV